MTYEISGENGLTKKSKVWSVVYSGNTSNQSCSRTLEVIWVWYLPTPMRDCDSTRLPNRLCNI